MEPIEGAVFYHPQWVQPRTLKNRYELRDGEHLFATLEFPRTFRTLAAAATSAGNWTFQREGFFRTRTIVRSEGQEVELAVYHPRWTGTQGKLEFGSGQSYTWKVVNFWSTRYVWETEDERPIITYQTGVESATMSDWFKTQARVGFEPDAAGTDFRRTETFALLVTLGWYLIVLKHQDDAAATAA